MKKILALLLAVLMLVAMAVPAMADDPAYDHPLTVTGLTKGDTAEFFKVIEWVGETTDNSDVSGWKAISTFASVLNQETLRAVLVGTREATADDVTAGKATKVGQLIEPTGITSEIAGELAKLVEAGNGTAGTLSEDGKTATLDNPAAGMWMALVTPTDANTIYNPVFVSADFNKDEAGTIGMSNSFKDAVAKKSTLTLTKTAENADDYNGDNAQTTAVGDTVTFTVNTTIPGYGDIYDNPKFDVKDSLTALTLDAETVVVKVGGTTLTDSAEYELVDPSASGYTVSFKPAYLKTIKTATDVVITYDAKVTSDAAYAINEETNDVSIEYSHNPNKQGDYDVKKDTTQHYTFSLDAAGLGNHASVEGLKTSELVKTGLNADGTPHLEKTETSAITDTETWEGPLEGATFELFKANQVTIDESTGMPVAIKTGETAYKTATTTDDGRMNFAGLDEGVYYLKEKSAPAGYVTNSDWHKIELIAETNTVSVTEWWNGSAWVSTKPTSGTAKEVTYDTEILKSYTVKIDGTVKDTYSFSNAATANDNEIKWTTIDKGEKPHEFQNTKGVELPSTGGMGTTILYVGGSILVLLAVILLVTKRRMNANDD